LYKKLVAKIGLFFKIGIIYGAFSYRMQSILNENQGTGCYFSMNLAPCTLNPEP
jgi:hypothetical protein